MSRHNWKHRPQVYIFIVCPSLWSRKNTIICRKNKSSPCMSGYSCAYLPLCMTTLRYLDSCTPRGHRRRVPPFSCVQTLQMFVKDSHHHCKSPPGHFTLSRQPWNTGSICSLRHSWRKPTFCFREMETLFFWNVPDSLCLTATCGENRLNFTIKCCGNLRAELLTPARRILAPDDDFMMLLNLGFFYFYIYWVSWDSLRKLLAIVFTVILFPNVWIEFEEFK